MLNVIRDNVATIDDLAKMLAEAKRRESEAKKDRERIEQIIVDAVGHKEEGAFTAKGDHYQITTTGKLTRTVDADRIDDLRQKIPTPLFNRLFNFKPSLNTKELRYVENNEPEYFQEVAKVITTKPAKTAVSFKEI